MSQYLQADSKLFKQFELYAMPIEDSVAILFYMWDCMNEGSAAHANGWLDKASASSD
jgi:hypothetical protein